MAALAAAASRVFEGSGQVDTRREMLLLSLSLELRSAGIISDGIHRRVKRVFVMHERAARSRKFGMTYMDFARPFPYANVLHMESLSNRCLRS